jgi:hypothetical protein
MYSIVVCTHTHTHIYIYTHTHMHTYSYMSLNKILVILTLNINVVPQLSVIDGLHQLTLSHAPVFQDCWCHLLVYFKPI